MSPTSRIALVVSTLTVLVAGFVLLKPTDDDRPSATTPRAETTAPVAPAAATSTTPSTTKAPTPAAAPPPSGPRIVVRDLVPVDGVAEIRVEKGDRVRFSVTSDRGETIHLHGYDIEETVAPGRPARFSFDADIEGIFEVELEDSAVPIAEVRVDP